MALFTQINGVGYRISGVATATPEVIVVVPARDDIEITPTLSNGNANGYIATASSEYSESGQTASAWRAFDKVVGNGWAVGWSSTGAGNQWLAIELPTPKPAYSYRITNRMDADFLAPSAWTFEGWTGSEWVILNNQSGVVFSNGQTRAFDCTPGVYLKYRLNMTAGGALYQIADFKIYS